MPPEPHAPVSASAGKHVASHRGKESALFGECKDIAYFSADVAAFRSDSVPRVTAVSGIARGAVASSGERRSAVLGGGTKRPVGAHERTRRERIVGGLGPSYQRRK